MKIDFSYKSIKKPKLIVNLLDKKKKIDFSFNRLRTLSIKLTIIVQIM